MIFSLQKGSFVFFIFLEDLKLPSFLTVAKLAHKNSIFGQIKLNSFTMLPLLHKIAVVQFFFPTKINEPLVHAFIVAIFFSIVHTVGVFLDGRFLNFMADRPKIMIYFFRRRINCKATPMGVNIFEDWWVFNPSDIEFCFLRVLGSAEHWKRVIILFAFFCALFMREAKLFSSCFQIRWQCSFWDFGWVTRLIPLSYLFLHIFVYFFQLWLMVRQNGIFFFIFLFWSGRSDGKSVERLRLFLTHIWSFWFLQLVPCDFGIGESRKDCIKIGEFSVKLVVNIANQLFSIHFYFWIFTKLQ